MTTAENKPMNIVGNALVTVLRILALILAASGALIVFAAVPYALMQRWHMLPHWEALRLVYLLFPIILAWQHAGSYILLTVGLCELFVVLLRPRIRRTKIEAGLLFGLCVLAYLYLYFGNRMNIH